MFADVSGFTTFAERLDPEEVRAFQNALFETLARSVARYEGYVAKFMGDAVLAVFGAPIAHEDDPQRALDSALDMLAGSAALSDTWAARLGQNVTLHIALHTGPVVAGSHADALGTGYDITGDTVNTASRLLSAAAPGTILASNATYVLTRHRFAFEPAGELTLRGKSEPIAVHRLTGVLAQPRSARGLATIGLTAPLVGRNDELDQLLAAFHRMQRGRTQLVSLVGEAGTGKSRLIAEMLTRLEAERRLEGIAIRRAECSSLGEPTYGVFAALFREAYQMDPSDSLAVAHRKLVAGLRALGAGDDDAEAAAPALSCVLGIETTMPEDIEPAQLRRQIVLAVRTVIERRIEQQPLLIIVEDLHWADSASVDLIRQVVDQLSDRALMVVLSHRPDARPPLVARAAQSIIRLAPLAPDETRALVAGLFGSSLEDVAHLPDFIAQRAGGNPLFVEEIVRSLVGRGLLVRQGDRWACTAACETVDVPPTLQGLLLSRVDRLSGEARRLLQEAAVLGMEFDEPLLLAVATDARAAAGVLDFLIEADLIQQIGPGRERNRYRFTHALVHEVVYQNLLLARRTELHERAGRALERVTGPNPERLSDLEALGHHWSLAADKAKGAHYLVAAGDRSRAVYANDDAIRHYERALATLADCNAARDAQIQGVRERLADLLALTGRRADALAHYEALRQELDAAVDRAGAARLCCKIGGLHWEGGERERASACFASGLERLGADGHPIERAQLFQEIGRLAFRAGDNVGAIAWAERALAEVAKEQTAADGSRGAAATRAHAYNTLGVALARTGRLEEAVKQIEQSIGLAEAHDLLQETCRGYANLGVLYSSLDPRRSIETCLRGLETAKKVGDLGFQSRLYANLAVAYCALTDRCEAEGVEAARIAVDLDRRLGLLDHLAVPLIVLGQIHQCHGDHDLAFASYEEALRLAEQVGEPQLLFPCYDGLATLYLDAGNPALAEVYLTKSQEVCVQAGLEPDALLVLPFLS
jgi:adenylate cyclase